MLMRCIWQYDPELRAMKGNTISSHRPSKCKINGAYVGLIDEEAHPVYKAPP